MVPRLGEIAGEGNAGLLCGLPALVFAGALFECLVLTRPFRQAMNCQKMSFNCCRARALWSPFLVTCRCFLDSPLLICVLKWGSVT